MADWAQQFEKFRWNELPGPDKGGSHSHSQGNSSPSPSQCLRVSSQGTNLWDSGHCRAAKIQRLFPHPGTQVTPCWRSCTGHQMQQLLLGVFSQQRAAPGVKSSWIWAVALKWLFCVFDKLCGFCCASVSLLCSLLLLVHCKVDDLKYCSSSEKHCSYYVCFKFNSGML